MLFAAGWMLFGYAALPAGLLSRALSIAIVAAGIVGFLAASAPYAVPLGLALVWMGLRLTREQTRRGPGRRGAADDSAERPDAGGMKHGGWG